MESTSYLHFIRFTYIHLCVCDSVQFYHTCRFVDRQNTLNTELFHHLKYPMHSVPFIAILTHLPHTLSLTADNHKSILYLHTIVIQECYINRILQSVTFWDWHFHSAYYPWDLYRLLYISIVCPCFHSWVVFHSLDVKLLKCLPIEEHLSCYQYLAITNKPAMHFHV